MSGLEHREDGQARIRMNDEKRAGLAERLGWALEVISVGLSALQTAYQSGEWGVAVVALGCVLIEVYERLRYGETRRQGIAIGISAVPCALAGTGRSLNTAYISAATLLGGPLLGFALSQNLRGALIVICTTICSRMSMSATGKSQRRSGEASCVAAILSFLFLDVGAEIAWRNRSDVCIFVLCAMLAAVIITASVFTFPQQKAMAFLVSTLLAVILLFRMSFTLVSFVTHSSSRLEVICVWLCLLLISLPTISSMTPALGRVRTRKLFHVLAVILFAPVTYKDPIFMAVAYGGALAVFIWLEAARFALPQCMSPLSVYYQPFLAAHEDGPLALSHIYLLFGCAAPHVLSLAFSPDDEINHYQIFSHCLIGLLVLGIADAAAAVCGSTFGKCRWPHSQRTLEGSLAFLIASIASFGPIFGCTQSWQLALILTLVEASTSQTDNLVLPLHAFGLIASSASFSRSSQL